MTNKQIASELRRSALYDVDPFWDLPRTHWYTTADYLELGERMSDMEHFDLRVFLLLVAEAIE